MCGDQASANSSELGDGSSVQTKERVRQSTDKTNKKKMVAQRTF